MEETVASVLTLDSQPMCCAISPTASLLASGLVDGSLLLHTFSLQLGGADKGNQIDYSLVASPKAHAEDMSCRAVAFSPDGAMVFSGSADRSICVSDTSTGKVIYRMSDAHEADLSAMGMMAEEWLLASGDEDGLFKLWDVRSKTQVMQYKKHTDFISCITRHTRERCAVVASGDGTLSVHDLRQRKAKSRSEEDADDEILSVAVVKNGKKLVTGTQSGVLNIYSWGHMRDCSDRFPGHPESVDTIVKFDESTVLTGSSDGAIRIVSVLPNKLMGILGSHDDFPVERMALSSDRRVLASTSHDSTVRLWDLSFMVDDDGEEAGDKEEGDGDDDDDDDDDGINLAPKAGTSGGVVDQDGDPDEDEDGEDEVEDEDEDGDEDLDDDEDEDGEDEDGDGEAEEGGARHTAAGVSGSKEDGNDEDEDEGKADDKEGCGDDKDKSEDDDSDSDDEPKKKKTKGEKTKWRKGGDIQKLKQEAAGNFFKDLL